MKFSIVTCVYNNREHVKDAISSVIAQQGVDLEFIIMDGGSKDGTVEAINEMNIPNVIFESGKDAGIYDALNKGFRKMTGDVYGLLHSDDLFASNDVLKQVQACFQDGADVVYADLDYVDRNDVTSIYRRWISGPFKFSSLKFGWIPPHPSFYIRKEVFKEVGEFDLSYRISADYDFMLRVLMNRKYKITYLPITAVKMRRGGESNKSIKNSLEGSLEDYRIAKKHFMFPLLTVFSKISRKMPQLFMK